MIETTGLAKGSNSSSRSFAVLVFLVLFVTACADDELDLPRTDFNGFLQITEDLAGDNPIFCGSTTDGDINSDVASCFVGALNNRINAYAVFDEPNRSTVHSLSVSFDSNKLRIINYNSPMPPKGSPGARVQLSVLTCFEPIGEDVNGKYSVLLYGCETPGIKQGL